MHKALIVLFMLLSTLNLEAQNRNSVVKLLNNYVLYANANVQGLTAAITTLERYNGLFNDYVRSGRQLGGEAWEKPKLSPFLDEDVFTIGEDNPDYLYKVAVKASTGLPANLRGELNKSMLGMWECSQKIVVILDSLSTIFSDPLINVTTDHNVLPYRLLYDGKHQLQQSKMYRDQMFTQLNAHYAKACKLSAAPTDYIHSVDHLQQGVQLCQYMLDDLSVGDSSKLAQYAASIDSLHDYLVQEELILLRGIQPTGNSNHFPNKGNFDGFDLYAKYEDILGQLRVFSRIAERFSAEQENEKQPADKCYAYHTECLGRFNGSLGLLYYYNEYVLLIGGGKMKLISEGNRIMYKGWSDGTRTLPVRTQLFWMKETPRFEVAVPK